MQDPPSTVIANPIVHDKSDSIVTGAPGPYAENRTVTYRDGSTTTQRKMPFGSGMSYLESDFGEPKFSDTTKGEQLARWIKESKDANRAELKRLWAQLPFTASAYPDRCGISIDHMQIRTRAAAAVLQGATQ